MSNNKLPQKFRGTAVNSAARLIEQGRPLIKQAAKSAPCKVIALRIGADPRQVENWRARPVDPRWAHFMALAQQDARLRMFAATSLRLTKSELEQLLKFAASLPEEGDRGNE
jgi:hypothetical protein